MATTISSDSYRVPVSVYIKATAVTPSDSTDLSGGITRGLWVGSTGNLSVVMADGNTSAFTSVPAGTELKIALSRVRATGTTANNLLALY